MSLTHPSSTQVYFLTHCTRNAEKKKWGKLRVFNGGSYFQNYVHCINSMKRWAIINAKKIDLLRNSSDLSRILNSVNFRIHVTTYNFQIWCMQTIDLYHSHRTTRYFLTHSSTVCEHVIKIVLHSFLYLLRKQFISSQPYCRLSLFKGKVSLITVRVCPFKYWSFPKLSQNLSQTLYQISVNR
jgi:hypothetical protein